MLVTLNDQVPFPALAGCDSFEVVELLPVFNRKTCHWFGTRAAPNCWQGSQTTDTQGNLQEELIEAFLDCQESIVQEANVLSNTHSREMTSSAALGIVCWPVMHLAWAGNCRC